MCAASPVVFSGGGSDAGIEAPLEHDVGGGEEDGHGGEVEGRGDGEEEQAGADGELNECVYRRDAQLPYPALVGEELVEMEAVGTENVLAQEHAVDDGEDGVDAVDGHEAHPGEAAGGEHEAPQGEGDDEGGGDGTHVAGEADGAGPEVAEAEDGGGDGAADEEGGVDEGLGHDAEVDVEEGQEGEEGVGAGEAVDTVHEVPAVDEADGADEPGDCHPPGEGLYGDEAGEGDEDGHELHGEAGKDANGTEVVGEADDSEHGGGGEESGVFHAGNDGETDEGEEIYNAAADHGGDIVGGAWSGLRDDSEASGESDISGLAQGEDHGENHERHCSKRSKFKGGFSIKRREADFIGKIRQIARRRVLSAAKIAISVEKLSYLCSLMNRFSVMLCAMATATSVYATGRQDTATVRRPHTLNEVEVLGVKQMPTPGNTPVTVLSGAQTRRLGVHAVKDLGDIVPNLYTPAYGSRMTSSIYMRGLGSRIDQAVVGLTVDGVPFLTKDSYDFDLYDIANVSVLRGAQSVLNGRNAMAGQINIYTLSPRDWQGVRLMAEYGRANSARVSAGVYTRVRPGLFTSVSGAYNRTDGYWRNAYNNSRTGAEQGGSVRWKTVWAPSAALSVTNTAAYSGSRQSGYPYASVSSGLIEYNDTCLYRRNLFSDGLTVAWSGKRVVVTSLTSVCYLDDRMTLDQDFTAADYFTLRQARKEWTVTEDLFAKGSRGRYSWLGGVFGYWRRARMSAPVTFYEAGISSLIEQKRNEMNPTYPISWDKRSFPLESRFTTPSYGFALYHQSRWTLGDWVLDAALRWDVERVGCDYSNTATASYTTWHVTDTGEREVFSHTPVNIAENGNLRDTYNELLPKLSVARLFDFGRAYATVSKAYKAGGFNTQMFSDVLQQRVMELMGLAMIYDVGEIVTYRPETSWNYEAGIKTTWLNGRLSADAVAFFINCRDQQLTMFPPGTVTGRIMTNAGRTHSCGIELSGRYEPVNDVTINASYGYTRATFAKYNNGREDFAGKRLPYAPAHTLFISAAARGPEHWLGFARPAAEIHVRGAGDIYWNEANTLRQPFYALAGASVALETPSWTVKVWGENLTSTRYDTFYFMSMGNSFVQRGNPWSAGVTLRLNINFN